MSRVLFARLLCSYLRYLTLARYGGEIPFTIVSSQYGSYKFYLYDLVECLEAKSYRNLSNPA